MKANRVNPAVYAGLMAQTVWFVPTIALGRPAAGELDLGQALVPFAAGLGIGLAAAGTISAIAWHRSKKALEAESIARAGELWCGTDADPDYIPKHLCAPGMMPQCLLPMDDEDSSADLMRTSAHERLEAEAPKLPSVPAFPASRMTEKPKAVPARPRPSETASISTTMTGGFPKQTGSFPKQAPAAGVRSALSSRIPTIEASAIDDTTAFLAEAGRAPKQAAAPQRSAYAVEAPVEDYGDIASVYVERMTWADRMAQRARGVRSVLAERLGKDMDDLPVIKRADGTVGDVGTSWWERAYGKDISRELNVPVDEDYTVVQNSIDDLPFSASVTSSRQAFVAEVAAPAPIATRIAPIDEGIYPERREVGDMDRDAMWKSALDALAEHDTQAEPNAAYSGLATPPVVVDDDEAFSQPTASLTSRHHADAPAIDTEAHITTLVRDEMDKSRTAELDRHEYLRVIDGGGLKSALDSTKAPKKIKRLKPRASRTRSANEA